MAQIAADTSLDNTDAFTWLRFAELAIKGRNKPLLCSCIFFPGETSPGDQQTTSGSGAEIARQWEVAIRQALMPVQATGGEGATGSGKPASSTTADHVDD